MDIRSKLFNPKYVRRSSLALFYLLSVFIYGISAQTQYRISVVKPVYATDISGDTTISLLAPGLTSITPRSWKQDATYGHDSVFAAITLDGSGNGSFRFPASLFPHGPLSIRLFGSGNGHSDTCYLQLYNTGGVSWNEGLPAAPPPAVGLPLVFSDDFTVMPSISSNGAGATYNAHTRNGKDFSVLPFANPSGPSNPFLQRDTYLRIRADSLKNSTGFLSTLKQDGTGMGLLYGYFECRLIAGTGHFAFPAFWGVTCSKTNPNGPCDEVDVFEGWGEGVKQDSCMANMHTWDTGGVHIGHHVDMTQFGSKSAWYMSPHVYGTLITPDSISFYLDNIKHWTIPATPYVKKDPFYPMVNYAWDWSVANDSFPSNLGRYNKTVDMYVDYLRAYQWVADTKWPYIQPESNVYSDSVAVTMQVAAGVTIHYTLDGSTPTAASPVCTGKLTIKNSATLKAIGILAGASSAVSSVNYTIFRRMASPTLSGLQYKYYEYDPPAWDSLQNLSALTPVKTGIVDSFNLSMKTAGRTDRFAVRFNGIIKIDTAGPYTFWDYSDAGSRFYLSGNCVINNDGRPLYTQPRMDTVPLEKGYYSIALDYFQDSATSGLALYYQGPGMTKVKIPKSVLFYDTNQVATRLPVLHQARSNILRVHYLQNRNMVIGIALKESYSLRIARPDGRTVKTMSGKGAAEYSLSRSQLQPGIYIISVVRGSVTIASTVIRLF